MWNPLARLLPEVALLDEVHEHLRRRELRLPEAVLEHPHDAEADVEADEVGELERPHRVVEADLAPRVDVLGGAEALLVGVHRLREERHQDPVDDEPGPVGRDDDLLAELAGDLADRASVVVGRRGAPDELDSGITGTGLKKCMPTNRAARAPPTAAASLSMAIDEVFEAKTASAGAIASRAAQSRS